MFEYLKDFPVILVTGPQRSGTRICAKMIAHDTGHRFVDEREIHTDSVYELIQVIRYQRKGPVVVQCPALCYAVGWGYITWTPEIAVVLMRRSIHDIYESQKRIDWGWGNIEHLHYANMPSPNLAIAQRKYWTWDNVQRQIIMNPFEVEYDSLSAHPLWVPKEQRKDWDAWQTEANDG